MNNKYLSVAIVVFVLATLFSYSTPFVMPLEQQVQDLHYKLRGPVAADTNVVLLYFDNQDIAALGGWPLKRNLYALMVDELDRAGVAAIGIDVVFDERHVEYPEYDDLFAAKAAKNGKVVFSAYFRQLLTSAPPVRQQPFDEKLCYSAGNIGMYGEQLTLPLKEFLQSAAGIGHANFMEQNPRDLPLFVQLNDSSVGAFSLELLRLSLDVPRENVRVEDHAITFGNPPRLVISFGDHSVVRINFPGPLSSFRAYRSVEMLRAFELQRAGFAPSFDVSVLKNKIVVIGVIAEGRINFIPSPFSSFFPPVAMHAAAIDNALQHRFLRDAPRVAGILLNVVLVLLAVFGMTRFGIVRGMPIACALLLLYFGLAHLLFMEWNLATPLLAPTFLLLSAVAVTAAYELTQTKTRVAALESEKALIESELRARELKLQSLEGEFYHQAAQKDRQHEQKLVEEIKRYKEDIKILTSKVTDLVGYEQVGPEQDSGPGEYEGIIYDRSGKMVDVVQLMEKISSSEANVLILGESGTGKELVARAIHHNSHRTGKPFVAINCGAIPETLLESELFGHVKGAFTGAVQEKDGRFDVADGGTMFLDEVAETSEAFQVKLLRVVQQGEFERVGSSTTRKVNVRILAATNKDVKELLNKKRFREDLYYRLNVFTVQLPPLRERKGDIPLLVHFFLKREGAELTVSSTVMDAFLQYPWPGNVRELESALKRSSILTRADRRTLIRLNDISKEIASALESRQGLEEQILELLRDKNFSRNSISETASELGGINRGTVAEYFRGTCFRFFLENGWDFERSVRQISRSTNPEANSRVHKKVVEYLGNLVEGMQNGTPYEELEPSLKPKYKNLPQRYHPVLHEIVRAFLHGKWVLPQEKAQRAESGPSIRL